jgi:uncharacterized protein (DUF433 family)
MINSIMFALQETISTPLAVTEQGTIRIKGSRVSLDSIIHHFKLGATAEQIVQSFPSLSLGDVYTSIAYYLTHRQEIEEYLKEQETAADALQEQLESNPDYKPRSPNYALAYWAGGRRRERTARERLWSRHGRAASQIGTALGRL